MGGMEGIKGERDEQQSDGVENHDQHGFYLGRFEVQKVRVFIYSALYLLLELRFVPRQGARFRKNHENKWSEVKNGAGRP